MKIEKYDNITGDPIGFFESLDFKDLIENQHSFKPTLFRLLADPTDNINTNLKMFLSNKGDWEDSLISYYNYPIFIPAIESGDNRFNYFSEVQNPTIDSSHGITLGWNIIQKVSDYIWLDITVHNIGINLINFTVLW